jgi:SAM-dependent methyltransferase
MHDSVYEWVGERVGDHLLNAPGKTVLEIGSMNVNGSVRDLFDRAAAYYGVDIAPGEGVDLVCKASELPWPDRTFDVVVCTEMLEHDETPWVTVRETYRVLRRRGWAIFTTRGIGFPLHGYPSDYWRFTNEGLKNLLVQGGLEVLRLDSDPGPDHPGAFALAFRPS